MSVSYRLKIVSIGHANIDIYLRVPRLPEPDSREVAEEAYLCPGGAALNYAVMTRALGHDSYLVACVGNDLFGEFILSFLSSRGVRVEHVSRCSELTTGVVTVLLDCRGMKYMIAYAGANMKLTVPDEVRSMRSDLLYVVVSEPEILESTVRALANCEAPVSIGLRPQIAIRGPGYLKMIRDLLKRELFTIFMNKPELLCLTRESSVERALESIRHLVGEVASEIIVTLGDEGSIVVSSSSSRIVKERALRLGEVVDTTGAGDVYAAVYNVSRLCGLDQASSARLASLAAAAKVLKRGASNVPLVSELQRYATMMGIDELLRRILAL